MPSSMIFAGLVVIWLLILVPAVARHRQEVARPSVAALSGRVLERPQRRRNLEVDVMDEVDQRQPVATRPDQDRADDPEPAVVPAARSGEAQAVAVLTVARAAAPRVGPADPDRADRADVPADGDPAHGFAADLDLTENHMAINDTYQYGLVDNDMTDSDLVDDDLVDDDLDGTAGEPAADDRRWERPSPRYRPGRGGFDPEAADLAARARYAFRQRVVLAMLVVAAITGLLAAIAIPELWWPHIAVDVLLVGYLTYLRRQVRMEGAIRERRAARMAGTRRPSAAEDPELDEWARRGRAAAGPPQGGDADRPADDLDPADPVADDLDGEQPDLPADPRPAAVTEVAEPEPALPRLQPTPPPPLPAGTSLVEPDDEDPELHDLAGPPRLDYRRAVGE